MSGGVVVEEGSHDELMAAGRVYADMWQMQQAQVRGALCHGNLLIGKRPVVCVCVLCWIDYSQRATTPCTSVLTAVRCSHRRSSRRRYAWHRLHGRTLKPAQSLWRPPDS